MHIAIEGCSHGELDVIYRSVQRLEEIHNFKIDLLLCCGDFQSVRNVGDLKCMAVPTKYLQMQDFHKYYSGEKKAPILTIFIGGNHEASNYLQELPYGGWVAPNIYYLGYAGVVRVGDLRIGGLSGIYKAPDYLKGHYEQTPYTSSSRCSVYHVRNLEVFRLKQLSNKIDIFMSHDWPRGIHHHGNVKKLLKMKHHFEEDIKSNKLGSRPAEDLIKKLRPSYWFSGHLHVKFPAIVKHEENIKGKGNITKFLALDKCLPRREFLQVLELPSSSPVPAELSHDAEWLTILRLTNHLLSTNWKPIYMPGPGSTERYNFTPTSEEIHETVSKMGGNLTIPVSNFTKTAECFSGDKGLPDMNLVSMPEPIINSQTTDLCSKLSIDDPLMKKLSSLSSPSSDFETTSLGPFNKSEMDITQISVQMTDSSNISCNPEEIDLSDEDEFEICKDGESGDFIMELPLFSSINSSKEIGSGINVSPIRETQVSTLRRGPLFSPIASSPRNPSEHIPKKNLSLSKPKISSLAFSSLEMREDEEPRETTPPPPPLPSDNTASESSPTSSLASFLPFSGSSQSEEESDTAGKSLSVKRDSSCEGSEEGMKSPQSEGKAVETGRKCKKLKRRNVAIYASAEEDV